MSLAPSPPQGGAFPSGPHQLPYYTSAPLAAAMPPLPLQPSATSGLGGFSTLPAGQHFSGGGLAAADPAQHVSASSLLPSVSAAASGSAGAGGVGVARNCGAELASAYAALGQQYGGGQSFARPFLPQGIPQFMPQGSPCGVSQLPHGVNNAMGSAPGLPIAASAYPIMGQGAPRPQWMLPSASDGQMAVGVSPPSNPPHGPRSQVRPGSCSTFGVGMRASAQQQVGGADSVAHPSTTGMPQYGGCTMGDASGYSSGSLSGSYGSYGSSPSFCGSFNGGSFNGGHGGSFNGGHGGSCHGGSCHGGSCHGGSCHGGSCHGGCGGASNCGGAGGAVGVGLAAMGQSLCPSQHSTSRRMSSDSIGSNASGGGSSNAANGQTGFSMACGGYASRASAHVTPGPIGSAAQRQALAEVERIIGHLTPPERLTCSQELKRLQSQQQWRESRHLMAVMGRAHLPADVGRYNALILWYKKNRQWGEALAVLGEMRAAGAKPSIVSFNSVIDACGKARQLKAAFELLGEVSQEGLSPDTVTYTSLIDACGKAQQLERAFSLLNQMKSVGVRPNSFTYNALIDACAKAAEVDRAFDVRRQMESEGITANTTTYTSLIDACGKSKQLERAFRVLGQMQHEGVKPNTATYTCLVDACGKGQQLESAFEVLQMMKEARVQANTHTVRH